MNQELDRYRLPEYIRKAVLNKMREETGKTGSVSFAEFGGRVLRDLKINWRDYAGTAATLTDWLRLNFPEMEPTADGRGVRMKPTPAQKLPVTPEVCEQVAQIILETLGDNPVGSMPNLGSALLTRGIDRKKYTGGGLGDWLKSLFPMFQVDGLTFTLTGPLRRPNLNPAAPAPVFTQVTYPAAESSLSQVDLDENIRQMHSLAHMGWWSNNVSLLKQYTGHNGNDTRIWSGIVAQYMTDVLLGRRQAIMGSPEEGLGCAAVYSGLDTQDGLPIYCIFVGNDVKKRPPVMLMREFCWPGREDSPAVSQWLEECLRAQDARQPTHRQLEIVRLEECCGQLKELRGKLRVQLNQALERLDADEALPLSPMEALTQYNEVLERIQGLCVSLEVPPELTGVEKVLDWCSQQNQYAGLLTQLTGSFEALTKELAVLTEKLGIWMTDLSGDLQAMEDACSRFKTQPDCAPLQAVLLPYQQALELMNGPKPGDELFALVRNLDEAFGIQSMMLYALRHRPSYEELVRSYRDRLMSVQTQLSLLDRMSHASAAVPQEAPELPQPRQLLDAICKDDVLAIWTGCGGENRLEKLIVEDRLPEALAYAADRQTMEKLGFTLEQQQEICAQLVDEQSLPAGYTLLNIARRLRRVLGGQNATAERYFLMGMLTEPAACCEALLELYRGANRQDDFMTMWERFGALAPYNEDNYRYYLGCLRQTRPEQVPAYLDSHVFLYHMPQYASLLGDASEATPVHEPNALEELILSDAREILPTAVADTAAMAEFGYTPEQIGRLSDAVVSEDIPSGSSLFDKGMRIYHFQGNHHGLAEHFLWEAFAREPSAEIGSHLVCLLAGDGRFSACCRLYRSIASLSGISSDCRRAYLTALLHTDPQGAQQEIRDNLQGLLLLASGEPKVAGLIDAYRTTGNDQCREFYGGLYRLVQLLQQDYPRSVLLHDRSLREMVTQPALLAQLGLDDRLQENARTIYQSGSYPQGADAMSVAKRAYAFLGSYNHIARELARFCLPATDALVLLWNIACDSGDTGEQDALLAEHPDLRRFYPHAYSNYLFGTGQHERFLEWLATYQSEDDPGSSIELLPEEAIQQLIVELLRDPQAQIAIPVLEVPLSAELADYLTLLAATLAGSGRTEDVAALLVDNFEPLLFSYSADVLKQIMTAEGCLSDPVIAALQARALEEGCLKPAVYYYNTLGVGELSEQAEAYYAAFLERCAEDPSEARMLLMDETAKLYPGRQQELHDRIYLTRIHDLLGKPYSKTVQTQLLQELESCPLEIPGIRGLIDGICASVYAGGDAVVQAVAKLTDRDELLLDGLVYLHRTASAVSKTSGISPELAQQLIGRYNQALNQDCFPQELGNEAEMLCRRILLSNKTNFEAAFCLFRIELRMDRRHRAQCVLRYLCQYASGELDALYPVVEAAAEDFWNGNVPTELTAFVDYANTHSPWEIMSYCEFAQVFTLTSDEDWTVIHEQSQLLRQQKANDDSSLSEYNPCTETDGESMVKALCAAPEKYNYWWVCTALPGLSTEARAKLLFVCGMKNPVMYKECAQFCVEAQQNRLLLQALKEWISAPSPAPRNCRAYLSDILDREPGFFDRWAEEEDARLLLSFHNQMCADVRKDLSSTPANVAHTALSALSAITVAIGSPEALAQLEEHLSGALHGNFAEVGVATVLRLLLSGQLEAARSLIDSLHTTTVPLACRLLINQLHEASDEELRRRCESAEHRRLWGMLLPDGNRPAAQVITPFVLDSIGSDNLQMCADVVTMLLDIFPEDSVFSDALFILCKYPIDNRIPLLHKALCGLISGVREGNTYIRRDALWNAKLLAGLNAVIHACKLEPEVLQFNPGYDFDQEPGQFYQSKQGSSLGGVETSRRIGAINRIQRTLTDSLQNLHPEQLAWKRDGILSWITGNWADFLYNAWVAKTDVTDVSLIRNALQLESTPRSQTEIGFCLSLLRVAARLQPEEHHAFLRWIFLALGYADGVPKRWQRLGGKPRQAAMAYDLLYAQVPANIGDLPLELPLDEYSLYDSISLRYITPCASSDPRLLYNRMWLMGAVVDYSTMLHFQYHGRAKQAFEAADHKTAAVYYEVLLQLLARGLVRQENVADQTYNFIKEQYQAFSRFSRRRLGDRATVRKLLSPNFHVWSCANMTLALLGTPLGNEAFQMSEWFAPENRQLCLAIIHTVNPHRSDESKLQLLQEYPNGCRKVYLAYLMRSTRKDSESGVGFSPRFFDNSSNSQNAWKVYNSLAPQFPDHFCQNVNGYYQPKNYLLVNTSINSVSYNQLPVEQPEIVEDPVTDDQPQNGAGASTTAEAGLPGFARSLTALEDSASLQELKYKHKSLPHMPQYYQERLALSEQIYRIVLSRSLPPVEFLPHLIRYGLDYFDNLDLDNPEEFTQAYRAIMELVVYADTLRTNVSAGYRDKVGTYLQPLEIAVENTILYALLSKSHPSIQSLVSLFLKDRKTFAVMQDMVRQDNYRKEALAAIFTALDLLGTSYTSGSDIFALRKALGKAKELIGSFSYGAWHSLKISLLGLIQAEIGILDQRPILALVIHNRGVGKADDYLYGEVRNEGLAGATDVTLQVVYDDRSSERLRLAQLDPGEHVAFKIRYRAPEGASSLRYTINWSYVFGGQTQTQPNKEGILEIGDVPTPTFPVNLYQTQTITYFDADEKGGLSNPDFFGRARETEALRGLFRRGRFPEYGNAIVYGIRRAGKTTLLNYVSAYVKFHCPDAIIVKVDCLLNTGTRLVQNQFIDAVLQAVASAYPEYAVTEDWQQLVDRWSLAPDAADREPTRLEAFFRELKLVTGKGLILMLDEVDKFFASVEQQASLDSYLFQVLSNMLCSASCQEAVHFIFCGSSYLLRYQNGDGGLSQLFQRFGSNIIEVGLIPKDEMTRMIRMPYRDYPEVKITDEAIDWIWEYTQGLVWHVKLLGNRVLEHVRSQGRSVVYPMDVRENIHSLVEKACCEQFFDGINGKEQDKRERLVLDAIQSQATLRTSCVSRAGLQKLFAAEGSMLPPEYRMTMDQLEAALDNLLRLKLIVFHEARQAYSFPVDLYRMYFRTQREFPFVFRTQEGPEQTFVHI